MRMRKSIVLAGGLFALLAIGMIAARDNQPLQGKAAPTGADDKDTDAIHKVSRDFAIAFAKGDAKAVASFWTANGEYHDDSGAVIRGRADIETAFAEFFKEKPNTKIEIHIESVRFPSRDSAIEEGMLRQSSSGKDLPTTTFYRVVHVREGGQWKMAMTQEWGAGQDRLEDLAWLIGTWQATLKDRQVSLSFKHDNKKPFLIGEFTAKVKDKIVSSGTMKIGFDPQRGQLRSWHFEDDGGHGEALWIRDGNRWVLDAVGVQADGTQTAGLNLLGRINNDELTWRSIDRVMGDEKLPDTVPIKLSRVGGSK